ncbi:MAG: iron ABC transporter permease [Firmicutes bacterium]|nr:iron ABC transporter permease [Bacillota bacterium]
MEKSNSTWQPDGGAKKSIKWIILPVLTLLVLALGVSIGSADISLGDVWAVLMHKLFGAGLPETIRGIKVSIVWSIRFPQVIMAFVVGASLAASGTVMQSVLRNPLASSYTLGVSSGASLAAAVVIVTGAAVLGSYTLPIAGFAGGLVTVFLAMALTMHFDRSLENQTVILVGMVLSLFVNGLLTLVTALSSDHLARLIFWQMGSFTGQTWGNAGLQFAILTVCLIFLSRYSREMDLMTFGDEQAMSAGVNLRASKLILIAVAALLTGSAVSMVGVIGFVDLIAPHVVRRWFGSNHRTVVPVSAVLGGVLMVIADLIGRTIIAPRQLPVGAVTALIGAPFFAYLFFKRRKGEM